MQIAALLGASGVTIGAFGAHALKATLEKNNTLSSWKTAVEYQLIHSVALLSLSLLSSRNHQQQQQATDYSLTRNLWVVGICLFSGSIYGLCLGGPRLLGPVTPLGGLCLIGGWLALLRTGSKID
jgi:uncharacterized membrane protein YgdD (TMEM256/DUF423 family)